MYIFIIYYPSKKLQKKQTPSPKSNLKDFIRFWTGKGYECSFPVPN